MTHSASSTVWQVRPVADHRYRVKYCCRGGPTGTFDVLLTPGLREVVGLPPAGDDELVLGAVGVILDRVLPLGLAMPHEKDLETIARSDPAFVPELRRRLGVRDTVPQPR